MLKLIKLELKRNNIRTYLLASVVSCIVLLGFIYFIASAAQLEDCTTSQLAFRSYENIFRLIGIISLVIFSTMSGIMYSKLVIGEYTGKRVALLFSYPVSRSKILVAKLVLVFAFTFVSMRIGFIHKSVPTTLISSILLSTIYGNAAINASGILSSVLISGVGLIVAIAVMFELSNKVNKMEVE